MTPPIPDATDTTAPGTGVTGSPRATPQSDETARLLADLVAIESVNPQLDPGGSGESALARFVLDWCRDQGLAAELIDDGDGRPNVLIDSAPGVARTSGAPRTSSDPGTSGTPAVPASPGRTVSGDEAVPPAPTLLLCAHLDTVGLASMADPLTPRIDGDRLYGRGAYDMKAGLAAMMIAARDAARDAAEHAAGETAAQPRPTRVILAAVADEEHASLGMQRVLDELARREGLRPDLAIVGEPTEMAIGVAHKGFVWTEIDVTGLAAHGSRPELGIDAIVKTGALLRELEVLQQNLARRPHPLLGPGTVHASLIEGGQEPSSIPEHCRLTIERRTLPGETSNDIEAEVATLLDTCRDLDAEFTAEARTTLTRPPMEIGADHRLVTTLAAAYDEVRGAAPDVGGVSYWADSALITAAGIPTVLFGPGGEGAHADVEWVSLTDTADCAAILRQTARRLACAEPGEEAYIASSR